MSKILIFTHWSSWLNLDPAFIYKPAVVAVLNKKTYPNKKSPIVKCNFKGNLPAELVFVSNCEQEGVYLVDDSIAPTYLSNLESQCSSGTVIVLRHEHTPNTVVNWLSSLKKNTNPRLVIREGKHEDEEIWLYPRVFAILTGDQEGKMSEIVKFLMPTDKEVLKETVLRFLMGSLKPNNTEKSFLTAYKDLCGQTSIGNDVKMFYEKSYKEKKSLNEYKDELTKLRDKLIAFSSK